MTNLVLNDLAFEQDLNRRERDAVTGGGFNYYRRLAKILIANGVGPYNPDPATGGPLADEYQKILRRRSV